jgi:hypothetical protein
MLLLDIITFELENITKIFELWENLKSKGFPEGIKVVNQWFDAGGGRIITVYDVESVKDYVAFNFSFTELCHVEVFPVVGAEEFQKFVSKCVGTLNLKNISLDT